LKRCERRPRRAAPVQRRTKGGRRDLLTRFGRAPTRPPERLFWNIYDHGWIEGTERVEAILEFDVLHHDPGAVLSIADVVVR
jgi:hypothetical protein